MYQRARLYLYLFNILLVIGSPIFSANCITKINKIMEMRHQHLLMDHDTYTVTSNTQIVFKQENFSDKEKELIITTVNEVNQSLQKSGYIDTPPKVMFVCDSNTTDTCLYFHRISLKETSIQQSSQTPDKYKKGILLHEYGHSLYNIKMTKIFDFIGEEAVWKNIISYRKERDWRKSLIQNKNDIGSKAYDSLMRMINYGHDGRSRDLVYSGMNELFADFVAVVYSRDLDIISNALTHQVNMSIDKNQLLGLKRSFSKEEESFNTEEINRVHTLFSNTRSHLGKILKNSINHLTAKAQGKVIIKALKALRDSIQEIESHHIDDLILMDSLAYSMERSTTDKKTYNDMAFKFNMIIQRHLDLEFNGQ